MRAIVFVSFLFFLFYVSVSNGQDFFQAIQNEDLQRLDSLLKEDPTLLDTANMQGNTPLHMAAYFGKPRLVEYLIDAGADVNANNDYQRSPLIFANATGSIESAKILVDHGTRIDSRDDHGRTPLHWVAIQGQGAMAEFLFARGADIHELDDEQKTPLHWAALQNNVEVARLLINKGALVNVIDDHSRTPLFIASWEGSLEMVQLLIENEAVVDARYLGAASPLTTAAVADHADICRYLVEQGARVNLFCNMHVTPLYPAVYNNNLEMVEYYLDRNAKVNYRDIAGRSPLYIAVRDGYTEVAKRLVQAGAEAGIMDPASERNLLHVAAANGRSDMLAFLVDQGLDVNASDKQGWTPLDYAGKHQHPQTSKILLEMGAHGRAYHPENPDHPWQVQGEGKALLVKLRNKTWGIRTQSAFLVFGYNEHGVKPANPSLANGCMTAKDLGEVPVYHFDGGMARSNPLYQREKDYQSLHFICNPHHEAIYRHRNPFEVENIYFPTVKEKSRIGGIQVTCLPAFGPYRKSYLVQTDGLNLLWLYQHSDRYLPGRKNTEAIEYLREMDVPIDIMLIGSTSSDMGPEWISVMEQEYEMARELDVKSVFPVPDCKMGELFQKERRRKGDGEKVFYAQNPGDRFFYIHGKVVVD